jgi:hypothetical protein
MLNFMEKKKIVNCVHKESNAMHICMQRTFLINFFFDFEFNYVLKAVNWVR